MDELASILTEDDLRIALDEGRVREGDHLDFKRELTPGDRGTREAAVDLASFAIEGGAILVGVTPARPASLAPIPLHGQQERIEQIARHRVDPPVRVAIWDIPSDVATDRGYLVVNVPATGVPHAVDGVFRGRRGTTNIKLTAAEVRAFHERQAAARESLHEALVAFALRDPFPPDRRRLGRLYILARPSSADPQMLQRAVGEDWAAWTQTNVRSGPPLSQAVSPDFPEAWNVRRMPDGWIASGFETPHRPGERNREYQGIEVELDENGTLRVFCSRATDYLGGDRHVAIEAVILGLVLRTLLLAAAVSRDADYAGEWEFGVRVTSLTDALSVSLAQTIVIGTRDAMPYPADRYERTWRGTAADLRDAAAVVDALVGPLNRTLNAGYFRTGILG